MTSPLLTRYGKNAELARGLKAIYKFESNEWVRRNGGTINSAPVINDGATFDGTDDYINFLAHRVDFASRSISFVCEFTPLFTATANTYKFIVDSLPGADRFAVYIGDTAAAYVMGIILDSTVVATIPYATYSAAWVAGGRNVLVVSSTPNDTDVYLNGTKIVNAAAVGYTPNPITNVIFGGNFSFNFDTAITHHSFRLFDGRLTDQECLDYCNNTIWDYREDTAFYLPMRAQQHDPVNLRTLDSSGNGNHFTFGDGATATTYPTKLARRGYSFDGGDYLRSAAGVVPTTVTAITMVCVIRGVLDTALHTLMCYGEADLTPACGILLFNSADNKFYFYGGSLALPANAASTPAVQNPGGVHVLIGTADGTQTQIYLDGVAGTQAVTPAAVGVTAASFGTVGTLPSIANTMTGEVLFAELIEQALTPMQVWDITLELFGRLNDV